MLTARPPRFVQSILAIMVAVVLSAVALSTGLNELRLQQTLRSMVEQRLELVSQQVQTVIQSGLHIGLAIESMDGLQAHSQRLLDQIKPLRTIQLEDCRKHTIFRIGPASAHQTQLQDGQDKLYAIEPEGILSSARVYNSFGVCAGIVTLEYDAEAVFSALDTLQWQLLYLAALALLWLIPASVLISRLFKRHQRVWQHIHNDLNNLAQPGYSAPFQVLADVPPQAKLLQAQYAATRPYLCQRSSAEHPAHPNPSASLSSHQADSLPVWQHPALQALLITAFTVFIALGQMSWMTARHIHDNLLPELAYKNSIQAAELARNVQYALQLGIPAASLQGLAQVYANLAASDPDLAFVSLTTLAGQHLEQAGVAALTAPPSLTQAPLQSHPWQYQEDGYLLTRHTLTDASGAAVAHLYTAHTEATLYQPLRETLLDLLIVLVVALLLAMEVMLLVTTTHITRPLDTCLMWFKHLRGLQARPLSSSRDQGELGDIVRRLASYAPPTPLPNHLAHIPDTPYQLTGVRLLAFLFVFAEELARPVMPSFFGEISLQGGHATWGAGVIMSWHLATIALAMPLGSLLYPRFGRRQMYLGGALLATLGLVGSALADSLTGLLLSRTLSGLGYAATFVACQGFVIEATQTTNRTRGTAMMVSGIMLADICGPAIGGIVANWLGPASTFALGGSIAALAACLALVLMDRNAQHTVRPPHINVASLLSTLRLPSLWVVLLWGAVPAKLLLSGLLFYLIPLSLVETGHTSAQVGRIVMLYGLAGLLCGPVLARLTDHFQRPLAAVMIGGAVSALGSLALLWDHSITTFAWAVIALGVGQGLSIPALLSTALNSAQSAVKDYGEGPVLASLRLLERLGGAAGPLIAAFLSKQFSIQTAFGCFALYALFSVIALALWWPKSLSARATTNPQ